MKPAELVESLPQGMGLFKINLSQQPLPGQWLTMDSNHFHIFKSEADSCLFVAKQSLFNSSIKNISISGEIIDWEPLINSNDPLILFANGDSITSSLHLIYYFIDQMGHKILQKRLRFIILSTEESFPFKPIPSLFMMPGFSSDLIASSQLLEDLKLPARLVSTIESPGCYKGNISSLLIEMDMINKLEPDTHIISFGEQTFNQGIKKLLGDGLSKEPNKQFYFSFPNSYIMSVSSKFIESEASVNPPSSSD